MARNEETQLKLTETNDGQKIVETYPKTTKDCGWAWIVVFASFFINGIIMGITSSFGLIYIQLIAEFKESRRYTSWIPSLLIGLGSFTSPIASNCVEKYGFRTVTITGTLIATIGSFVSYFAQNVFTLIITIGFGMGFGLGILYLPSIVCVNTYFEKLRSIAMGISVAGSGVGIITFPPIIVYLNEKYGWRVTMLAESALLFSCVIAGSVFRPLKTFTERIGSSEDSHDLEVIKVEKIEEVSGEHSDYFSKQIISKIHKSFMKMMNFHFLKDPIFILYAISDIATITGYYIPFLYLADQATDRGVTKEDAGFFLSIIGIVNTLCRIFWGYISDKTWINRLWLYNTCLIVCGFVIMASIFCFNYETFAIFSIAFGSTASAYVALQAVILVDMFGIDKFNNAFGLIIFLEGFGILVGPPAVAFLFDVTQSYTIGILLAGAIISFSGFILFFTPILQKRSLKKPSKIQN